jgi:hypothetical protein
LASTNAHPPESNDAAVQDRLIDTRVNHRAQVEAPMGPQA